MAGSIKEVELLQRPPTDFRRMVSWELSEVRERVKKKKKRKKSQVDDGQLLDKDQDVASSGDDKMYSSDEEFYSALESPLSSDEEAGSVFTSRPATVVDNITLPETGKRRSQSKKKKKQKAQQRKIAREEFFRPICELFEDEDSILGVSDLSLTDMGNVLSLTEMCLIKIQQVIKTHNFEEVTVPYIFQMMITQDRILKSTAAVQMRWAERNFATLEMFFDMLLAQGHHFHLSHLAIHHQSFWLTTGDFIPNLTALHCPIPESISLYSYDMNVNMGILRMLLHFCDFLFPLFGATGSGLDKISSQIPAVYRVNHFLKTRYPKITKHCAEGIKLWLAYVCWARGHMRQATDFFMEAVSTLKDKCDKAICLNELGRMMSWYGDREYSVTFFRKSLDVVLEMLQDRTLMQEERLNTLNPRLVQASSFAMMASNWDVGAMDKASARGAKLSWQAVLKEYDSISDRGVSIWYFHEAAMESQLYFHSTQPVEDINPNTQKVGWRRSLIRRWLDGCEEFALKYAPDHPVLYYHLSLVNALAKLPEQSRKNFRSYINGFAGFQEWPDGRVPGNPLGLPLPLNHRPSPWEALVNLTTDNMKTAPVLPLYWRTRLLHPFSREITYLADHCSEQINLHFTEDGYLTGDMSMDFPPMRCVLLDPFTGKVTFSQSSALAHYSGQFYSPAESPAQFAAPQPLRLLTTDWCSIELVAGYSHDLTVYCRQNRATTSCYHTVLHWYGNDGTHAKLDIRKIIRKSVKDSLLSFFHTDKGPIEDKIKRVEGVIDKGLIINWQLINSKCPLDKVTKSKRSTAKTSKEQKSRNTNSVDFYLHMTHHCIIGDNTLLLTFQLDNVDKQPDNVLLFVPCSSLENFMNPVVHYSVDSYTVWLPEFDHVSCYHNNHLPHIRYVYTTSILIEQAPWKKTGGYVSNQNRVRHEVFDEYGKVLSKVEKPTGGSNIRSHNVQKIYNATNDDRLYKCNADDTGLTSTIESHSLPGGNRLSNNITIIIFGTQPRLYALPGCMIAHSTAGVYMLDPTTLTPMPCKMLQASDNNSRSDDGGILRPQFDIVDCILTILGVFNISWSSNKKKQNHDTDDKSSSEFPDSLDSPTPVKKATMENDQLESSIANSCCVAMAINNRLIILKIIGCELVVRIDVELPGMITEFHDTGGNGYLVASSVFHNRQREDVYWLSREGRLLGVIPCLGSGPHSFCTKFLEHKSSSEDDEDLSGTYTFFNDGYGGISSVRLIPQ